MPLVWKKTPKGIADTNKTQGQPIEPRKAKPVTPSSSQPTSGMKEEIELPSFDFSSVFANDESLSEDFKAKATTMFETLLTARTSEIKEQLLAHNEQYLAQLEEETYEASANIIAEKVAQIEEGVNNFMNHVATKWLEENKLAVENGLRTEITEDFINGLRNLFAENYIEVPEDRYDLIGEMQTKISDLEAVANEKMNESVALSSELAALKKEVIMSQMSEGLAQTEAEKLKTLATEISFEDESTFVEKMNIIKENYFPRNAQPTQQTLIEADDSVNSLEKETSSTVLQYAQALSKTKFTN